MWRRRCSIVLQVREGNFCFYRVALTVNLSTLNVCPSRTDSLQRNLGLTYGIEDSVVELSLEENWIDVSDHFPVMCSLKKVAT